MPCSDEAHGHDHNGGCEHDHDVPLAAGPTDSLYPVIDTEHVVALNAAGGAEKGRVVIKWVEQLAGGMRCEVLMFIAGSGPSGTTRLS